MVAIRSSETSVTTYEDAQPRRTQATFLIRICDILVSNIDVETYYYDQRFYSVLLSPPQASYQKIFHARFLTSPFYLLYAVL
jgi:hypothetical protein